MPSSSDKTRCGAELTASDWGHGGANQRYHWDRNSVAHPEDILSTAVVAKNTDTPERGRMNSTAKRHAAKRSSAATYKRVPKMLRTTRRVTLAPRGTEEVGGALAAETSTGAKDEDEEATVQATKAQIEGAVSIAMAHRGTKHEQLERGGLTEDGDEKGMISAASSKTPIQAAPAEAHLN